MGKVSGWGWGFGYFGGMLALGMCLAYVLWAQARGVPADAVRAGHHADHGAHLRRCVAGDLLAAARARQPNPEALRQAACAASLRQLRATFAQARRYRDFMWLLACAVFYQGGVAVAITLAAIYAEQVIGFQPQETMVLIFVLNIAAAARRVRAAATCRTASATSWRWAARSWAGSPPA